VPFSAFHYHLTLSTFYIYLSTTIGDQVQHERYTLRRINGQWLIDEMKVVAERFLGQVM